MGMNHWLEDTPGVAEIIIKSFLSDRKRVKNIIPGFYVKTGKPN
jgi:hypothetical protein